jgi:hypothetical protein
MKKKLLGKTKMGLKTWLMAFAAYGLLFSPVIASEVNEKDPEKTENLQSSEDFDQIRGTVKDPSGEPIPGATVLIELPPPIRPTLTVLPDS